MGMRIHHSCDTFFHSQWNWYQAFRRAPPMPSAKETENAAVAAQPSWYYHFPRARWRCCMPLIPALVFLPPRPANLLPCDLSFRSTCMLELQSLICTLPLGSRTRSLRPSVRQSDKLLCVSPLFWLLHNNLRTFLWLSWHHQDVQLCKNC